MSYITPPKTASELCYKKDYSSLRALRTGSTNRSPDIWTRRPVKALFRLWEVWYTTADTSE